MRPLVAGWIDADVPLSDRVLVLDRGKVLEYDSPRTLMQDGGSAFRALCMVQGKEEFERLLEMTKEVDEK